MALVSVFVAAPVILLAASDPDGFFDRTRVTSVFTFTPREQWVDNLTSNLVKHSLMFGREGDANPRHNLPRAPMLDYVTGALFVLGFFFALTRWRSGAVFILPFWVFFMTLPGILTLPWEAPQSLRSILVIPAVAALSAYVLERLWSAGRAAPWRSVRRFTTPVILAILALGLLHERRFLLRRAGQRSKGIRRVLDGRDAHSAQSGRASETRTLAVGVTPVLALAHRQPAGRPPQTAGHQRAGNPAAGLDTRVWMGASVVLRAAREGVLGGDAGLLPGRRLSGGDGPERRRAAFLHRVCLATITSPSSRDWTQHTSSLGRP